MARKNFGKAEFAKTMDDISEKSVMTANAKTTVDLPVDQIDPNPDNELIFGMEGIDTLANTIKTEGFYGAIEVYKKNDGRYEVSSGHRRLEAVKLLGWNTIPAIIEKEPDPLEKRSKLVLSNVNFRSLNAVERMNMVIFHKETILCKLAKEKGVVIDPKNCNPVKELGLQMKEVDTMVGEALGISWRNVMRYLMLKNIRPEFIPLLKSGRMAYTIGSKIAEEGDEVQRTAYEIMAEDGMTENDGEDPSSPSIMGTYAEKVVETAKRRIEYKKYQQMRVEQALQEGKATISRSKPEPEKEVQFVKPPKEDAIPVFEKEKEPPIQPMRIPEPEINDEEPVTEPEQEEFIEPEKPKNYIDRTCRIYAMQFKAAVGSDFEIEDKAAVKRSLDEIKEAIKKIEKML